jgi:hypothetical protein
MTAKKFLLASCGTHVSVVGPDGKERKRFTPGVDAEDYSGCTRLAALYRDRWENVGTVYRLEQWRDEVPGGGPGSAAHWQSNSIYSDEGRAKADRDRFNAEGGEWRVVRQVREVVE